MSEPQSLHEKLEYLVRATGRRETEVIAEALEEGLVEIYRKQITSAYLEEKINHEEAVARLGKELVHELDYAREAVIHDVKWGLAGE